MLVMDMGRRLCVDDLAFSPDGRSLAAACEAGAFFWHTVADAARAAHHTGSRFANKVRFAADGRWLFVGCYDLWRIEPATWTGEVAYLWAGYNMQFDAAPGVPYLLASQCVGSGGTDTRLALWRADDITPAGKVWEQSFPGYTRFPPQFLAGGDRFVRIEYVPMATMPFSTLRLRTYDTATGAALGAQVGLEGYPYEALVAPDGRSIALRGTNHITVAPLGPDGGSTVVLRGDGRKHFTGMAFHPSSRFLAATNNDHTVKLLDTATGTEARTFTWQLDRMRSVCFSPDGTLAAAGNDKGKVVVWDVDL